ncbi:MULTISPECIES: hypothetical protein [Mycobacterium]|uniref:hypothetical protein n=1 Tax=Mycobacterium TaxID=1763 RepID=UPI001041C96A|nr:MULTISPECIES: hypothetical protein [Mycobacterium]
MQRNGIARVKSASMYRWDPEWSCPPGMAVAVLSVPVLGWSWTPLLLMGALTSLVPLGLTGHSSSSGGRSPVSRGPAPSQAVNPTGRFARPGGRVSKQIDPREGPGPGQR